MTYTHPVAFYNWCAEHDIEIDPRLEIRVSTTDGSMTVFSKKNANITPDESLVRIPKSIVFSAKTCSRSRVLLASLGERHHDSELEPSLDLALAFRIETSLGPASPWHVYFLSLPTCRVNIAVLWGIDDSDQDSLEALTWIRNTEIEKILSPFGQMTLLERINEYFENTARPILQRLQLSCTLGDFYRAYSVVSSRAFVVDAYLGLSLLPVADAFNHVEDNQVHLQSHYYVCPICGSLDECDHDIEDAGPSPILVAGNKAQDTCEMVANLPIGPSEEIFNTYGDKLTNAQLLCQYGFMLEGNESNVITWTVKELVDASAKPEGTSNLWRELATRWPHYNEWDRSHLIYNIELVVIDDNGTPTLHKNKSMDTLLKLNADGQISHHLWLLLFALVLSDVEDASNVDDALSLAEQIARTQERLGASYIQTTAGDGVYEIDTSTTEIKYRTCPAAVIDNTFWVQQIAERIIQICACKLASAHCAELSASELGDVLDEMSHDRTLTRLAISYTLEERTILQSCQSVWTEMAHLCSVELRI